MSTSLHLARRQDFDQLARLVLAFHTAQGIEQTETTRRDALMPLLDGSPLGAIYLIGPTRAPVGYIVVSFGWSVEFGGMDCIIDEMYIRPAVRGRGMATEALSALTRALTGAGVRAFHLEVDRSDAAAMRLYARTGFTARERYMLMTRDS